MRRQPIQEFVAGLRRIPAAGFAVGGVLEYVRDNPVDPESLAPYVFYEPTHYTRNLIFRNELFELLAICWEVGQASRIHNHQGQNCWMTVPIGRLVVQNYDVVRLDPTSGRCQLRESDRVVMDPEHPAAVDPERPVHAVLNLDEHRQRSVSLHIYSLPYDHCLVYSLENGSYRDVPLFFDSEYGKPVSKPAS
jgi:cysteine dioxygenase